MLKIIERYSSQIIMLAAGIFLGTMSFWMWTPRPDRNSFATPPGQFAFPDNTVVLTSGQTAILLENVSVMARIPYQGEALYEGPVLLQRGALVVKPKMER